MIYRNINFHYRYYLKRFDSLGHRQAEPRLPLRKEMQTRVSCDHYEEGSCRWYDEWGYDHLVEYNDQINSRLI